MTNKTDKELIDKLPHTMEIPIPIPDPRPRGIRSLGALSVAYSIRFDSMMMERLDAQAAKLGIKRGEYIRWCSEKMLEAIDEYIEQHNLSADDANSETSKDDTRKPRPKQLELKFPNDEDVPATPYNRVPKPDNL